MVVLHPPAQCAKPPAEIKGKDTSELYTWSQNLLNQIKERETPEMKVGRKLGRFEGGREAKSLLRTQAWTKHVLQITVKYERMSSRQQEWLPCTQKEQTG